MSGSTAQLHHLADLYDVKTSYLDMNGNPVPASDEALLAVLKALGAPLVTLEDVPSAVRERRQKHWRKPVEPVIALWENQKPIVEVRLPASLFGSTITALLILENGEKENLVWQGTETLVVYSADIEGDKYLAIHLNLPKALPTGYHKLKLDLPGQTTEALIISAPLRAYSPPEVDEKIWGAFLPLYSLHSRRSWGAGDFADLETFMRWVSGLGGRMLGTLPLLPSFFDRKMGPGPYLPASRLFWNEFYLDISRIPELENCPAARAILTSPDFQKEISVLRSSHRVDYRGQLSLKRKVLEELSGCFFTQKQGRAPNFESFLKAHPQVEDYAQFRAAGEKQGICWHDWPRRMLDGDLKEGDYEEKIKQYYLYTQWLAEEQMQSLFRKSRAENVFLYLDLPVGVHPYSYDVWRENESFVPGVNGGAPPDPVFTNGQNWSFPPLHPEKIRSQGYGYVIKSLRHHLEQAGMLRIDHMMNFHRLFWIAEGMENREGLYVGYRADELYAILNLESCRHKSVIVGEDLGIVPPEVRPMMDKNGIYRMFVGQYELISESQMSKVPPCSVASLNTHDMFPFASFWQEKDITERQKLKLIDAEQAQKELEQRRLIKRALFSILQNRGLDNEILQDTEETLKAILDLLAASPAYALVVNLEDLWLEMHPQNIPGTLRSQNWSRRARYGFEEFSQLPQVVEVLKRIDRERKAASIRP